MSRITRFNHEFVEFIPDEPREGTLYVSMAYGTAMHKCSCGCGSEVVTPISPTDWQLTFDGETITLYPSIGSWDLPCRSHYWIENNRVRWAARWSQDQIDAGRAYDRRIKERYGKGHVKMASALDQSQSKKITSKESLWARLKKWW